MDRLPAAYIDFGEAGWPGRACDNRGQLWLCEGHANE